MNQKGENGNFAHLAQIQTVNFLFFQKSGSVSHGQLSSSTISEKTNNQILRKFSDAWIDRQQ